MPSKAEEHKHNFVPTGPEQPITAGWGNETVVGYVTCGRCTVKLCGQQAEKQRKPKGRYGNWVLRNR